MNECWEIVHFAIAFFSTGFDTCHGIYCTFDCQVTPAITTSFIDHYLSSKINYSVLEGGRLQQVLLYILFELQDMGVGVGLGVGRGLLID